MRLAFIAFLLLNPLHALAQSVTCPKDTPINIVTPTTSYNNVVITGEEVSSSGAATFNLKTDSGPTSVPKAIVTKCDLVNSPETPKLENKQEAIAPAAPKGSIELRLHGSNTIGAKLAPEFARAYAEKNKLPAVAIKIPHPDELDVEYSGAETDRKYTFHFEAHGSATAFTSLLGNAADIGMASRRINATELNALKQASFGDLTAPKVENVIALDGVVVIVNKDNPIGSLTLDQLGQIFSCEITNWQQLGGKEGPITVYARDARSGTFDTFKNLVLETGARRELCRSAKRFESSEDLSDNVAADESGIGFIGFAYVRSAKPLSISTSCGLTFAPEPFLVRTEEYPLARRLFFYVPEKLRTENVESFLRFVLSDEAQPVTASVGFIGL